MSGKYTPAVGDRVRRKSWPDRDAGEVLAVHGDEMWVAYDSGGTDILIANDDGWIKVEPEVPIPHRYIGMRANGQTEGSVYCYPLDASARPEVVYVVHIWTDEDGVDRIERAMP